MNGHKNDSNNRPKSRPISPDKPLDDLFPSRFLKPAQLLAWDKTQISVTVCKVQEEEVEPKIGQKEWKPVIYFETKASKPYSQGYLLSAKVDKDAIKSSTGAVRISDLIGKKITIKLSEYRGKSVLHIDPSPPAAFEPQVQSDTDPAAELEPGW